MANCSFGTERSLSIASHFSVRVSPWIRLRPPMIVIYCWIILLIGHARTYQKLKCAARVVLSEPLGNENVRAVRNLYDSFPPHWREDFSLSERIWNCSPALRSDRVESSFRSIRQGQSSTGGILYRSQTRGAIRRKPMVFASAIEDRRSHHATKRIGKGLNKRGRNRAVERSVSLKSPAVAAARGFESHRPHREKEARLLRPRSTPDDLDQRFCAAFWAISRRCAGVILSARASPPFLPPKRPNSTAA